MQSRLHFVIIDIWNLEDSDMEDIKLTISFDVESTVNILDIGLITFSAKIPTNSYPLLL